MKEIAQTIRLLLSETPHPPGYYDSQYSARERRQLGKALNETLWDEIALFRSYIRKFFAMQAGNPDPAGLESLVRNLDLLGLSCTRLARVMQVNHSISPRQEDDEEGMLNQVLGSLLLEWEGDHDQPSS